MRGRTENGSRARAALLARERLYSGMERGPAEMPVVLAYPNRYPVGMSNLGFQTILAAARRAGPFDVERLFLPEEEDGPLRTWESGRPAGGAPVLAFSISFENDYVHFLRMLLAARIPLDRRERMDHHPIVVVGGAVTFLNPEPLRPFADLFLLGEGEESVGEYLRLRLDDLGKTREAHLERAAALPGAYVPLLHEKAAAIERRRYERVKEDPATSRILSPEAEFADTLLIEISRGCPRRCRFCTVGSVFPKFRMVPSDVVVARVEAMRAEDERLGRAPLRKVGLVTSAFFDHQQSEEIAGELFRRGYEIGASSVRVDQLTDSMLSVLHGSGLRTLTIAPEAGTEELRRRIRKEAADEVILEGVARAARVGFRSLRAYFMVGLPFERASDLEGIVRLSREIRARFRSEAKGEARVTISLHPFVPKPGTPFQWAPMLPPAETAERIRYLRSKLKGFTVKAPGLGEVYTEGILARSGEEAAPFLRRMAAGGSWRAAARDAGLDLERMLYRERPPEEAFPWAGGKAGHTEEVNRKEWVRAAAGSGDGR